MSKITKNELNQLFKERNTLIKQKFNEYHANRKIILKTQWLISILSH